MELPNESPYEKQGELFFGRLASCNARTEMTAKCVRKRPLANAFYCNALLAITVSSPGVA